MHLQLTPNNNVQATAAQQKARLRRDAVAAAPTSDATAAPAASSKF